MTSALFFFQICKIKLKNSYGFRKINKFLPNNKRNKLPDHLLDDDCFLPAC